MLYVNNERKKARKKKEAGREEKKGEQKKRKVNSCNNLVKPRARRKSSGRKINWITPMNLVRNYEIFD